MVRTCCLRNGNYNRGQEVRNRSGLIAMMYAWVKIINFMIRLSRLKKLYRLALYPYYAFTNNPPLFSFNDSLRQFKNNPSVLVANQFATFLKTTQITKEQLATIIRQLGDLKYHNCRSLITQAILINSSQICQHLIDLAENANQTQKLNVLYILREARASLPQFVQFYVNNKLDTQKESPEVLVSVLGIQHHFKAPNPRLVAKLQKLSKATTLSLSIEVLCLSQAEILLGSTAFINYLEDFIKNFDKVSDNDLGRVLGSLFQIRNVKVRYVMLKLIALGEARAIQSMKEQLIVKVFKSCNKLEINPSNLIQTVLNNPSKFLWATTSQNAIFNILFAFRRYYIPLPNELHSVFLQKSMEYLKDISNLKNISEYIHFLKVFKGLAKYNVSDKTIIQMINQVVAMVSLNDPRGKQVYLALLRLARQLKTADYFDQLVAKLANYITQDDIQMLILIYRQRSSNRKLIKMLKTPLEKANLTGDLKTDAIMVVQCLDAQGFPQQNMAKLIEKIYPQLLKSIGSRIHGPKKLMKLFSIVIKLKMMRPELIEQVEQAILRKWVSYGLTLEDLSVLMLMVQKYSFLSPELVELIMKSKKDYKRNREFLWECISKTSLQ